jgi:hypothetical protein
MSMCHRCGEHPSHCTCYTKRKRKVIEFPSVGATYNRQEYGVYEYDTYPEYSVLAGQTRRSFIESFPTLKKARYFHPDAEWLRVPGYEPPDLSHLPDDTDY